MTEPDDTSEASGPRARLVVIAVAVALVLAGCGGREPAATDPFAGLEVERSGARQLDVQVPSASIGADVPVRILLPPGFDRQPQRRWPVLYLLHGCCDSYQSWTRSTDVARLSARDDVLVVMPDGGAAGFYSNWRRGPQWERFHLTELRELLQRRFRAGDRLAVAGLSMGGFGAMSYAARHPDLIAAAASFSGLLDPQLDRAARATVLGLVDSQGDPPLDLWGDPVADARTWRAHNPTALAADLAGTALFVSSGNGKAGRLDPRFTPPDDIEPGVLRQTRSFVARLRRLGIGAQVDLYGDGTHSWPYWQRELHRSWPLLMRAIGAR